MGSWRLTSPKYLQGFWPLNNHARDLSGKGNDGTIVNDVTYEEGPYGKSIAVFPGSDDYINLPAGATSWLTGVGLVDFSVSAFIRADAAGGRIFSFQDGAGDGLLVNFDATPDINLAMNGANVAGPTTLVLGKVYHVVCTRTDDDAIIYIDGEYENRGSSNGGQFDVAATARIGINAYDLNGDFNGNIWNVRLYSCALTQDESIVLNRMDKRI